MAGEGVVIFFGSRAEFLAHDARAFLPVPEISTISVPTNIIPGRLRSGARDTRAETLRFRLRGTGFQPVTCVGAIAENHRLEASATQPFRIEIAHDLRQ
jgi:hypothetical protein